MSDPQHMSKQVRWARRMREQGMLRITVWVPPGGQQAVRDKAHALRLLKAGNAADPRPIQKPRGARGSGTVPVRVWVPSGCRAEILELGRELRESAPRQ